MHVEHLIRMANQIGSFFEAMPDRPEALENAAQHLKRFWEPRMRRALLAHIDSAGDGALNPLIAEALRGNRGLLA
jgi:formate dehydrogenase subunit delta